MNTYLETRSYPSDFPVHAFYAKNNTFLAHWHIDVEMLFVLEGSIRIGVNKSVKTLHKGEMAIFGSTDIHYYDSENLNSKIIGLIFRPEIINYPIGWPENLKFDLHFLDTNAINEDSKKTAHLFEDIFFDVLSELDLTSPFYQMYVKGRLLELCALSLRYFKTSHATNGLRDQKIANTHPIQHVLDFIENNYDEDISLDLISKEAKLNPYYFTRLFKKFTGTNFKHYLSTMRVNKAEELIKTTPKSKIDIAYECGFNSVRTFNRTFKAVKGYTPSDIGDTHNVISTNKRKYIFD